MENTKCKITSYKDVCGDEKEVWFVINDLKTEGREFLRWAKSIGCMWVGGREIDAENDSSFFHLSISSNGVLAYVPMFAWIHAQYAKIKRIDFIEYKKLKLNY